MKGSVPGVLIPHPVSYEALQKAVLTDPQAEPGTQMHRKPWRVAVVRPNAAFMAPVEEQLQSAGLVAFGVAVIAVLAAVFFGTRVGSPVRFAFTRSRMS